MFIHPNWHVWIIVKLCVPHLLTFIISSHDLELIKFWIVVLKAIENLFGSFWTKVVITLCYQVWLSKIH